MCNDKVDTYCFMCNKITTDGRGLCEDCYNKSLGIGGAEGKVEDRGFGI